jgi:serine protease
MRRPLSTLAPIAALASVALLSSGAFAAPPSPPEPADLPVPTSESSWDVPGWVVIDGVDSLSDAEVADLGAELGVTLVPTDLEEDTRVELAETSPSLVQRLIDRLRGDSRVEHVEPLAWVRAFHTPDDPLFEKQWHMDRIGMRSAWGFTSGRGVVVAVVDTGVACEDHGPFRKGTDLNTTECVGGWNFVANNTHANDDQGHGSHVAGTIAQSTGNGVGASGVAFNAALMPVKVLNSRGSGTTADVADGIRWAGEHGADVINLSLGGPRDAKVLQDAVKSARANGAVVVAAAGNSGGSVGYPGGTDGVIGVSATGPDDKLAQFSSRGKQIDIAAPGVDVIQQTICNGGVGGCERFPGFSGTSMASPHVAGAAALVMSQGVTDVDAVESALKGAARVVDDSETGKKLYGAGILDAESLTRSTWTKQLAFRIGLLGALFAAVVLSLKSLKGKKPSFGAKDVATLFGAVLTGIGPLVFLPLLGSYQGIVALDVLTRPLGDWTIFAGLGVHKWLPLANALLPLGLTAVFFHVSAARRFVAGFSIGMAAYLVAIPILGQVAGPFGAGALAVWCVANAVVCAMVARVNLAADA